MNELELKKRRIYEDEIQHQIYIWFNNTYCLDFPKGNLNRCIIYAIPNGGSRNILEAKKFKNTGVLSGVYDLVVIIPNKVIFVELKAPDGRLSDNQKDFKKRVEQLGFMCTECWSFEEFKVMIEEQLKMVGVTVK